MIFGYAFLQALPEISAFPPRQPALVKPVTRVQSMASFLAIPRSLAPTSSDPLEHVLFALKHEGVNLQILKKNVAISLACACLLQSLTSSKRWREKLCRNREVNPMWNDPRCSGIWPTMPNRSAPVQEWATRETAAGASLSILVECRR